VKRSFRLSKSADFKRVRRAGKSYAHPFIVLLALPNQTDQIRIAVVAGRSVGSAVIRNRAKRLLRAGIQGLLDRLRPGWDIILIARPTITSADLNSIKGALIDLLGRANIIRTNGT